jgi:hypothetical protein
MSVLEAPTETPAQRAEAEALPDQIILKLVGSVRLDRNDARDVAIFREFALGEPVTLQFEGRCLKTGSTQLMNREGEPTGMRSELSITVHTVYKPVV